MASFHLERIAQAHERAVDLQMQQAHAAEDRNKAVREALQGGVSVSEIAAELGVDRQRVYAMAKPVKRREA